MKKTVAMVILVLVLFIQKVNIPIMMPLTSVIILLATFTGTEGIKYRQKNIIRSICRDSLRTMKLLPG